MFEDSEFLQQILIYAGVPENVFEYADPITLLFVFIFSSRLFVLFVSAVLWLLVMFIRSRMNSDPYGQRNNNMEGYGVSTHQYHDMNSMHKMYKVDKRPSFIAVVIKGFVLPVLVIYVAITISLGMVYGW